MPISGHQSLCENKASIIASHDKGGTRHHVANNTNRCSVSHYKIDGVVITNETSCDFLLINEDARVAYLIELKGSDLVKAAEQLEATERALASQLKNYNLQYRIVANKCKTQEIHTTKFNKYKLKWGKKLKHKTEKLEENI